MAKAIMVQGTMSNAGKSLLAAGLCRIFKQDGYRVAPFKSQNMALNSFITEEGLEMGRAQVMQAEAAGIKPSVLMNPILLKPTNDVGSQVIVNGEVLGTMSARDYFKYKKKLVPDIMKAYDKLASENDIIVIEGAGSPAEINLNHEDIVNMGMAAMADAPVLLVGLCRHAPMDLPLFFRMGINRVAASAITPLQKENAAHRRHRDHFWIFFRNRKHQPDTSLCTGRIPARCIFHPRRGIASMNLG